MKPEKFVTALLVLLTVSGCGINGSSQVRASAKTASGKLDMAPAYPAANPAAMPDHGQDARGTFLRRPQGTIMPRENSHPHQINSPS